MRRLFNMNRENIVRSIINSIDPKEYDIDDDFDIIKGAFLSEKVVNSYFNKVSPKESSISIKNMINGAFDILIIGVIKNSIAKVKGLLLDLKRKVINEILNLLNSYTYNSKEYINKKENKFKLVIDIIDEFYNYTMEYYTDYIIWLIEENKNIINMNYDYYNAMNRLKEINIKIRIDTSKIYEKISLIIKVWKKNYKYI